jgi:small subunit ribosomal protein S4
MELSSKATSPFEKRPYAPGQHGKTRRPKKLLGYALQLQEKQRARFIYGVLERQFRNSYQKAARMKGVVGDNLMSLLERRLDNVLYRIGFGSSRPQARQIVNHGHVQVNGQRVNIPSFLVKAGDVIEIREKSRKHGAVAAAMANPVHSLVPPWLDVDIENFRGKVVSLPSREDLAQIPVNAQLIVELYSR